jgi:hypothetical protein
MYRVIALVALLSGTLMVGSVVVAVAWAVGVAGPGIEASAPLLAILLFLLALGSVLVLTAVRAWRDPSPGKVRGLYLAFLVLLLLVSYHQALIALAGRGTAVREIGAAGVALALAASVGGALRRWGMPAGGEGGP